MTDKSLARERAERTPWKLGYKFRHDGMYLIARTCRHCEESFDILALQPVRPEDAYGLCPACESVRQMEMRAR